MKTMFPGVLLLTCGMALAQTGGGGLPNCTGMVPHEVEASSQIIGQQSCSAGISGSFGGVEIQTSKSVCPVMLVITPRHSTAEYQGHDTAVAVGNYVPNLVVTFTCVQHYFLLFVPNGQTCEIRDQQTTGSVANYILVDCQVPTDATTWA